MKYSAFAALSIAAFLSSSNVFGQTLPDDIRASKVVKSALDVPYVPMEYRDPKTGELIGFDVELAKAMGDVLGVTIKYQEGAFETLTPALQSKRVDMIMSGFYDRPARREYFDFVNYLAAGGQFFALSSRKDLAQVTDFCGKTVSTIRATSYPEAMATFSKEVCTPANLKPVTVVEESDVPQMLINMKTGRVDGAMQGLESIPAYMANEPDTYKPVGKPVGSALMGIAFNKDNTVLRDAFIYALRKTIADGTYDKLIAKYQLGLSSYKDVTINGNPVK
jgi:polar amino acid transport system substrate-binding protein